MKCTSCGIVIPDVPKDAAYEEMICNQCYRDYELIIEYDNMANYERDYDYVD
jgi:hypothetical protein